MTGRRVGLPSARTGLSDLGIAADGDAPLMHTGGRGMEIAERERKTGSYLNLQRLEPLLVSGYEQNGPGRLSHTVALGAN
jgi:hypothetical protein